MAKREAVVVEDNLEQRVRDNTSNAEVIIRNYAKVARAWTEATTEGWIEGWRVAADFLCDVKDSLDRTRVKTKTPEGSDRAVKRTEPEKSLTLAVDLSQDVVNAWSRSAKGLSRAVQRFSEILAEKESAVAPTA